MSQPEGSIVHIAGLDVRIGSLMRQRCAWCGAILADYDLRRVMVPADDPRPPGMWPVGDLVLVDGNLTVVVDHEDGQPLPDNACGSLDPEVTR